jgi:hypothetical protein
VQRSKDYSSTESVSSTCVVSCFSLGAILPSTGNKRSVVRAFEALGAFLSKLVKGFADGVAGRYRPSWTQDTASTDDPAVPRRYGTNCHFCRPRRKVHREIQGQPMVLGDGNFELVSVHATSRVMSFHSEAITGTGCEPLMGRPTRCRPAGSGRRREWGCKKREDLDVIASMPPLQETPVNAQRFLQLATLCLAIALNTACGPRGTEEEAPETETPVAQAPDAGTPLYVDPTSRDFSDNPKLLKRILASPHGYFRFINVPFSQEVCRRFSAENAGTHAFNLHGDAHLEQYAVTDLGRGLTDFDDSSTGPASIDLARLGVSVHLAARQQGFAEAAPEIFDEFLLGYRTGLKKPATQVDEPALARAKREKFRHDYEGYFSFVESVMEPIPQVEADELKSALADYFKAMTAQYPELGEEFFGIEQMGYLRQGIGSALDMKFLIRTRGASDNPLDDVVLEVKEVRDITAIDCIHVPSGSDPLRVLVGHSRIANEPFRFLGYARFQGRTFWVHAWVENYSELDLEDLESAAELREVAFDIGVQLGRGHATDIAGPVEQQLRQEQSLLVERDAEKIKAVCQELASEVVAAWEQFKATADGP